MQVRKLIRGPRKIICVAKQSRGGCQKKPRIKAARAARRRDGAKDQAQHTGQIRAQSEAGFLDQFAQCGTDQMRRIGLGAKTKPVQASGRHKARIAAVPRIDAPAGEHVFRWHEDGSGAALPHQHFDPRTDLAPEHNRGGGVDGLRIRLRHGLNRQGGFAAAVLGPAKSVHPLGPLQPDHCTFEARQQEQRQRHHGHGKHRDKRQRFGAVFDENDQQKWRHQMPDHQNCQIGGSVIGAVMVQLLTAGRAVSVHRQITAENPTGSTVWTAPRPAPAQRTDYRAFDRVLQGVDVWLRHGSGFRRWSDRGVASADTRN